MLQSPERELIIQFTPFDYKEKPKKPERPYNEEFKMYEKMVNKMFVRTQQKVDPVRVVLSNFKEKPYDDVHDYPADLGPTYEIKEKKLPEPAVAVSRVVKRVRSKF